MTIDEAIDVYKKYDACRNKRNCKVEGCAACEYNYSNEKYHEARNNIPEWLEELKQFREAKDLCKKECGQCDLLQSYIELHIKLQNELKFLQQWKADIIESLCKYDCDSIEEVAHNAYNKGINDALQVAKQGWIHAEY